LPLRYHIEETESRFVRLPDGIYRENTIERRVIDPATGNEVQRHRIGQTHARIAYDESFIDPAKIIDAC
jgi:hypothetical protein